MYNYNNFKGNQVRLLGDNKETDVVSLQEAERRASDLELDLICIAQQDIPVCIIDNYEKYCYRKNKDKKKRLKEEKKKQVEVKEIQFSLSIEEHDIMTKLKRAEKFMQNGDRVLLVIKHKGRELSRIGQSMSRMDELASKLSIPYTVVDVKRIRGSQVTMTIEAKKQ